jgi:hypothetical protein
MQGMKLDSLRSDAVAKIAEVRQRHHGVPKTFRRQGIKQVDHAVFHAPGIEAVDDMHDMRSHGPST